MSLIPKSYAVLNAGETVTIPFAIVNNTAEKVSGVTLAFDSVPSQVTYVANFKDVGTFNEMTGVWEIPSLSAGQAEVLWVQFSTENLGKDSVTITGTITNAENADYPGEAETSVGAVIYLQPSGSSFEGFATKELLSIVTGAVGDYEVSPESGVTYVFDSPTDDVTVKLPQTGSLDSGFFIAIKVINADGKSVYVDSGIDATIDMPSNYTDIITSYPNHYSKYTLYKSTSDTWMTTL